MYCIHNLSNGARHDKTRHLISATGEVTLGQALLRHLGVAPGEKIKIEKLPDGSIVIKAASERGAMDKFIGCLADKNTPAFTLDELDGIAAKGLTGRA